MACDTKDVEIRKLKHEISQLQQDLTDRTRNYMFNLESLKAHSKIMTLSNPMSLQQEGAKEAMQQQHEQQGRSESMVKEIKSLEKKLREREEQLMAKDQEILVLLERLKDYEVIVEDLRKKSVVGKEVAPGMLNQHEQTIKSINEELKAERFFNDKLKSDNIRLQSSLTDYKSKLDSLASQENSVREALEKLTSESQRELEKRDLQIDRLQSSFNERLQKETEQLTRQVEAVKPSGKQLKVGQKGSMTEGELKMKEELKQKLRIIGELECKVRQMQVKFQQVESVPTFDSESDLELFKKHAEEDRRRYEAHVSDLTKQIEQEIQQANQIRQNSQDAAKTIAKLQNNVILLRQQLEVRESQHTEQTNKLIADIQALNHENRRNINMLVERDDSLLSEEQYVRSLENQVGQLTAENVKQKTALKLLEDAASVMKEQLREKQVDIEDLKEAQLRTIELKDDAEAELAGLRQEVAKLQGTVTDLKKELKELLPAHSQGLLVPPEEKLRRSQRLTEQIKQLTKDSTEKQSQLIQYLKKENDTLSQQTQQLTAKLNTLQQQANAVEKELRQELERKFVVIESMQLKTRKLQEDRRVDREVQEQLSKKLIQLQQSLVDETKQREQLQSQIEQLNNENVLLKGKLRSNRNERESTVLQEEYYTQQMIKLGDQRKELEAKVAELTQQLAKDKDFYDREIRELNRELLNYRSEGEYLKTMGLESDVLRVPSGDSPSSEEQKKDEIKEVIEKLSREDLKLKQISSLKDAHNSVTPIRSHHSSSHHASQQEGSMVHKRKMTAQGSQDTFPVAEGEQIGVLQSELQKVRRELAEKIAIYELQLQQSEQEYLCRLHKKNKEMLEMENKMEEQEKRINQLKEQNTQYEGVIAELSRESESLRNDKGEKLDKIIAQANRLQERNVELTVQLEKVLQSEQKLKKELSERQEVYTSTLEKFTDQTMGLRKQLEQQQGRLQKTKKDLEDTRVTVERLETERVEFMNNPKISISTDSQTEEIGVKTTNLHVDITSAQPQEARSPMLAPSFHISDKLSAHHRTLSTEQIDMLGQKLTQLEKENKSLEEELQQMHAEKKNLENQLSVYEVRVSTNNLSSEKKLKDKDTMILATSEQVDRLKSQIERLNQVNTELEVMRITLLDQLEELQRSNEELKKQKPEPRPQQKGKSKTPVKQQGRMKTEEQEESIDRRKLNKEMNEKINQAVKEYISVNERLNESILGLEKQRLAFVSKLEELSHKAIQNEKLIDASRRQKENLEEVVRRLHLEIELTSEQSKQNSEAAKSSISELEEKVRQMEKHNFEIENQIEVQRFRQTAPPSLPAQQVSLQHNKYQEQASELKGQLEKLRALLLTMKEQYETEAASAQEATQKLAVKLNGEMQEQAQTYKQYIASLNQTIAALKEKNRQKEQANHLAGSQIQGLQQCINELEQKVVKLSEWETRCNSCEESLKQANNMIASLRDQVTRMELEINQSQRSANRLQEESKQKQERMEEKILMKLKREKFDYSQLQALLVTREKEIQKLEGQLHEALENQSRIMLRMKYSEDTTNTEALRQRVVELEKERSEMRAAREQSVLEMYDELCALSDKNEAEGRLIRELEMSIQLDQLTICQLEQKVKDLENNQSPAVSGCAQNLESEKRILREIEEIQRMKKQRQDELDEFKRGYQAQLSTKDKDIESLRKANDELTERLEHSNSRNHDLQSQLDRLQKKVEIDLAKQRVDQHRSAESVQLARELGTLKVAYNFVEKRSLKYSEVLEEAENDKMMMHKEVEHYKSIMEKTIAENKQLKTTAQEATDRIAKYKRQNRLDFKQFLDADYEQQLELQKKIERLTRDVSSRDKELAERNKEIYNISNEVKELRRQIKLDPSPVEYYTPQTYAEDATFQSLTAAFKKDIDRKNTAPNPQDHTIKKFESVGPSNNRSEAAELARYERQYSKIKQDLHSTSLQLAASKHHFEQSEKERTRLQLAEQTLEREIEALRANSAVLQQEIDFQRKRSSHEFAQFVNKLVRANWKIVSEPESGVRPRRISLDRSMLDLNDELKSQQKVFKDICKECYNIYSTLPVTSADDLFEPDTPEQLMNILKDIRNFSGSYRQREAATELEQTKRDEEYNSLIVQLLSLGRIEEERLQSLVSAIPLESFEGLVKKIKTYYKKLREKECQPIRQEPIANRASKKIGMPDELEFSAKNFNSGSEEFFDINEPTVGLEHIAKKEAQLSQCLTLLHEAEQKLKSQAEELDLQRHQIEHLKKVQQRCIKEHKKAVLVQKGRQFE